MATFSNIPDEWGRLDWSILQNGWISLYWNKDVLATDLQWFEREQYTMAELDCTTWNSEVEMHAQLRQCLSFPDYYGENWDALSDCLSELEIPGAGYVVVFRGLNHLNTEWAHQLLDVFARNARLQMLWGKRLIVLAQVDDADYLISPVGATPVMWNRAEWLEANRG
ncbi:MAG TPA: barnase inhibitor [Saprospirales bacterium]|nr:barnase inhibitor [Saprospirales bacterium]